MEEWKTIEGYEFLYMVSNHGRVKSLNRIVKHSRYGEQRKKGSLLKITKPTSGGYFKCSLTKNGIVSKKFIHVLVAKAFIVLDSHKPQVNHKNGVKTDNRVDNLEFVTNRENVNHYWSSKNKLIGACFHKEANKWRSQIRINGKSKHLGLFNTELEAHKEYIKHLKTI